MRPATLALLPSLFACVPSIGLELPTPEGVAAYALYAPGREVVLLDRDAAVDFAVGDEPLYAVTLGRSLGELTLSPAAGVGPRPLVTRTSTLWLAERLEGELLWDEHDEPLELNAPAFDFAVCFSLPGRCVRQWADDSPWCDLECDTPTAPTRPTSIAMMPERPEPYLAPGPCDAGDAPFGNGDCTPVAECPIGDPSDLPAGSRYYVPADASISASISDRPTVEVFVLAPGTYAEDVVADRRVTIWGICPIATTVQSILLRRGGAVGRITVSEEIVIRGQATLERLIVHRIAAVSATISMSRVLTNEARLDVGSTTATEVVVADGFFRIFGGTARLEGMRVIGEGRVRVDDQATAVLADLSFHSVHDPPLRVLSSSVSIRGMSIRDAVGFGAELFDSSSDVRGVRMVESQGGFFVRSGQSRFEDVGMTFVAKPFLIFNAEPPVPQSAHRLRLIEIQEADAPFELGGETPTTTVRIQDVHVWSATRVFLLRAGVDLTVDRALLRTNVKAIEGQPAALTFRDVVAEGVDTFMSTISAGRFVFERVRIADSLRLSDLLATSSLGTSGPVTFTDLVVERSPGFRVLQDARLEMERFDLRDGTGTAFEIEQGTKISLRHGRIDGYTIGMMAPEGVDVRDVFDDVTMNVRTPVDRR